MALVGGRKIRWYLPSFYVGSFDTLADAGAAVVAAGPGTLAIVITTALGFTGVAMVNSSGTLLTMGT